MLNYLNEKANGILPRGINKEDRTVNPDLQRKNNILIVLRVPRGGIRSHIKYIVKYINRDKYNINLLCPKDEDYDSLKSEINSKEVKLFETRKYRAIHQIPLSVFSIIKHERIGLIHSHGYSAIILSFLGNMILQRPHIGTVHNPAENEIFKGFKGSIVIIILGYIFTKLTLVICPSESVKNNLKSVFKIPLDKMVVIQNGIDLQKFHIDSEKQSIKKEDFNISTHVKIVSFIGRLKPQKGLSFLIEASRILICDKRKRDVHFLIVGSGGDKDKYQNMVREFKLSEYYSFIGERNDIPDILKITDLLIIPSLYEAAPLLPMEAAVMGVPIVGTSCLGLKETLEKIQATMVPPGDSKRLADAIIYALKKYREHKVDTEKMSDMFDCWKTVLQLENIYDKCLSLPVAKRNYQ